MRAVPVLRGSSMSRRTLLDVVGVLVAVMVVGGPALFTKDGFALDFTNHLWLVSVQQQAIQHNVVPTLFINTPTQGAFNPFFLFYGGTLYAATGLLAVVFDGHTVAAYLTVIVLSIAAAYGGFLWLTRQLNARSWMAHAPAITFISSAYFVTNLYGRGDWPEMVASSVIPLIVASAWCIARSPRIELRAAAVFVVSIVFFFGSHNVTLMWGSIALITVAVCLRAAVGKQFAAISAQRTLKLAGLTGLAAAVDAWFLIPDVLHARSTQIAGDHIAWSASSWINTPQVLFDPLRYVPRHLGAPALYVQAPVWFLLWALICALLLRGSAARELRRSFVALTLVLVGFLALILVQALYDMLPRLLQTIQLPYRLNTFVAMAVAGLVLVAVLAAEHAAGSGRKLLARRLQIGLGVAAVISLGLCVWQLWVPSTHSRGSYSNRDQALVSIHQTPRTWYEGAGTYADLNSPVVQSESTRMLQFDTSQIDSDHVTLTTTTPPGSSPFATNIVAGPYAVKVRGLDRLGRTTDGRVVLRRRDGGTGPVQVTIERSGDLTIPSLVSLAALAVLAGLLGAALLARHRGTRIG